LPFVNNYERALTFGQQSKDPKNSNFLNGFELMYKELKKILKSEGIEEIPIAVEKDLWDDRFHEALEEIETDKHPSGTILEVMQKGYLINGSLLTVAKVKVSKRISKKAKKQNN
jgi:molecular chaperone GrpE